ncbi:MAG: glycoside hydrolase N-terminal domain-containing protein [Bacteroidaceae bacterium]|nr:glycoside hydrolase N-terminal domain-containing protein [Bacteroidaceae bacterium]
MQLNEKSFWTGSTQVKGAYQNLGYLRMEALGEQGDEAPQDYLIALDLDEAVVTERWTAGSTRFQREYLVSNPDDCMMIRLSATKARSLSQRISLRGTHGEVPAYSYNIGEMGSKPDMVSAAVTFRVTTTDGTVRAASDGIEVTGASEIIILLAASTDYAPGAASYLMTPSGLNVLQTEQRMRVTALESDWKGLISRHLDDYQPLYGRMAVELTEAEPTMPTDSLVMRYSNGASEAEQRYLEQLYFAYGRYLLLASSRGMALPANLQGIWNNSNTPPWASDIHANINVQMNYWPAETANLDDALMPFLDWIYNNACVQPQWRACGEYVAGDGLLCFWGLNIFSFWQLPKAEEMYCAAPAWLCWHLWQHYLFTCDEAFLRERALPVMLGCTDFWMKRLVRDSGDDSWVCPQEWSPEQGPLDDGTAHTQQCVWMLFNTTLRALDIVGRQAAGVTGERERQIRGVFAELDNGLHTEIYNGAYGNSVNGVSKGDVLLREWKHFATTTAARERQHRHVSHLMCLYPFNMVAPGHELMTAVINSMLLRGERNTGWAMAWKMNLWARARRADMAYTVLRGALNHARTYNVSTDPKNAGIYYNLLDAHPPFQIDGNFGACAGILEMLMQSYGDTIRLLPSLPEQWAHGGKVRGMRAEGGFELDFQWQDAKVTELTVRSLAGRDCHILLPLQQDAAVIDAATDEILAVSTVDDGCLDFSSGMECEYRLIPYSGSGIEKLLVSPSSDGSHNVNGHLFDLSGRRLATPPAKGIYIRDGKKVLVK